MKQRISYTVQKNPLTALFTAKERTFYLSSPDAGTVEYLIRKTVIWEIAEGKTSLTKDDLAKIVAAATVKHWILRRPFARYLRQKLDRETLQKLALVVATLISPEDYRRPLNFETAAYIIKWPEYA